MNFSEGEVLEILGMIIDNPKAVLDDWYTRKDNEPLDLSKNIYSMPIYSFPVVIDGDVVATITTVDTLYENGQTIDMLLSKLLTTEVYLQSLGGNHDYGYFNCYLSIHKKFDLPQDPDNPNRCVMRSTFLDSSGKEIGYTISGFLDGKIPDHHFYKSEDEYCIWFNNGLILQIDYEYDIWTQCELGEKINEVINIRSRDQKINKIL